MRLRVAIPCVLVLLSGGCRNGPTVESIIFAPDPASRAAPAIRLYRNTLPRCSFEEIGLVSAQGGTLNRLADAIRQRAADMGGHAVVGLAQAEHTSPGQTQVTTTVPDSGSVTSIASFSVSQTTHLSGTVIRFADERCRT